ncbi:MAG: DNA polymerase I [Bacteroidia bacterium]|nr:DNA polymerase I [Bacteroidia bacterium]
MKLFLIDGHALVFKMYYAFLGRPMVNSRGVDTSILFGFTKYLLELIEKERPTHLAVSFDPPGGTFRNEMYPAYKANRAETPQLVIDALEPLTDIVKAMDIPVLMIKGFEADDVIGSAAKRFVKEGFDIFMVTPDKDYGQLVEPHVFQFRPGKAGGENELLGEAEICGKWGIDTTGQVIDILAICGDAADNVPGVQGVGPVGASKLLKKYGTLESIYEHLDELTPGNRTKFESARDHIALSKELVTIKTDIELDVTAKDLALGNINTPEINAILSQYEMPSLIRMLKRIQPAAASAACEVSSAPAGGVCALQRLETRKCTKDEVRGEAVAIKLSGDTLYVASANGVASGSPAEFKDILEDAKVTKAGAGMKEQINRLHDMGIEVDGRLEDIELMHYLLNPERSHKVEVLAKSYLGIDIEPSETKETGSLFDEVEEENEADHAKETAALRLLADCLKKEMAETEGIQKLYDEIEEPLIGVLARMEQAGVRIDLASLKDFADGLRVQMLAREREVRELAGVPELNVSSPKQIGEVIFERLKLDPKAKKPKTGNWPTDEQTLQELSDRSPIIDAMLDYRGLRKLLSTYIEPFPGYISQRDGRVHTTFNQALTSTGRLSSSNPNLQNIPVRTEQGREIRKAFVAEGPGKVMMSADYSQIELRIMAHLCGDEHMCAAFREGTDVHAATAAKIFHCKVEDVTADQRRVAKTANFGIMYGISAFGLSQRLKCSRSEAKKIIDDYFESFPSIRGFIDGTVAGARTNGYVETLFGRRRYVPDVNSQNANVRALAERNAVNAPIQGTSADIIKLAMIGVDRSLREAGLKARMVLQIHDELVLEVPVEEIEKVKNILVEQMEGVINLSVPLTVECSYGKTWLEAH